MSQIPPTRRNYVVWDLVSALQKSIRRSEVKAAVYWAVELHESGHRTWAWNRLQEICSEDIGPADRYLPATIDGLRRASERKAQGGGMQLVHATILLATAKKSGVAGWMVVAAASDHHERLEVPDEAYDMHTRKGRQMGRGTEHFAEEGSKLIEPDDAARSRGYTGMADELAALDAEAKELWASTGGAAAEVSNVGAAAQPAHNRGTLPKSQEKPQLSLGGDQ